LIGKRRRRVLKIFQVTSVHQLRRRAEIIELRALVVEAVRDFVPITTPIAP
jgi:hypothetical protein